MKVIHVYANNLRLEPGDPYSQQLIDGLKKGKLYKVEIKEDRSRGELNLYWAGIGLLVDNYTGPDAAIVMVDGKPISPAHLWPTSRKYHNMLMESAGLTERQYRLDRNAPSGYTFRNVVDSIALDNMGDEDFKKYFEIAQAITERIFGWSPWDEWKKLHPFKENWKQNWHPGAVDD